MIVGKARAPLSPNNFRANGGSKRPRYTSDIVLTWYPRKRGSGCGVGILDNAVDSELPEWEGLFKIEVVNVNIATIVRTVMGIDDLTWTYTHLMNSDDNGSLVSLLTFYLYNYKIENNNVYLSDPVSVMVRKE